MSSESIEITDDTELNRYEARLDGELVGFVTYRLRGDRIVFVHTEVLREGQGVGSALVRGALDDVRRNKALTVVALCPFVKAFLDKHPEYADLT